MRRVGLAAFLVIGPATVAADSDPAFGYWLVENKMAIIEVFPCGESACGKIAWLERPVDGSGLPKTDANNPDPALRERKLCGLPLLEGLAPAKPGVWEDGAIYNSRNGKMYGVEIKADGNDRLVVRGYVGLTLLGQSQTWERVRSPRGGCLMTSAENDR